MQRYSAIDREPVEEFELPEGAVIEGYYIDPTDGLRYPYGRSAGGVWAADADGWTEWPTTAERDAAWERVCAESMRATG